MKCALFQCWASRTYMYVYVYMCVVYIGHKSNVRPYSQFMIFCWFYHIDFVTYSCLKDLERVIRFSIKAGEEPSCCLGRDTRTCAVCGCWFMLGPFPGVCSRHRCPVARPPESCQRGRQLHLWPSAGHAAAGLGPLRPGDLVHRGRPPGAVWCAPALVLLCHGES